MSKSQFASWISRAELETEPVANMQRPGIPRKRNLLLCLDAFGTLFRPKAPIERQYIEVATRYGVDNLDNEASYKAMAQSFRSGMLEDMSMERCQLMSYYSFQRGVAQTSKLWEESGHECIAMVGECEHSIYIHLSHRMNRHS